MNEADVRKHFSSPVSIHSSAYILVLSGNGHININYQSYRVEVNQMLILSTSHLLYFEDLTPDFRCLCLLVDKEFRTEMDSVDMIYCRIKYSVSLFNTPILQMDEADAALLLERIQNLDKVISRTRHLYYKEIIVNSLLTFYLDLSDIGGRVFPAKSETDLTKTPNLTRHESIIQAFIELLIQNYRREHQIEFYASRLNLSTRYLTLIVKRITGQRISECIFELLYCDARNLLKHSQLSIQEITSILHFADQSSFGKFFKRRAGISPFDYRKNEKGK